jgi:hypothetical protein
MPRLISLETMSPEERRDMRELVHEIAEHWVVPAEGEVITTMAGFTSVHRNLTPGYHTVRVQGRIWYGPELNPLLEEIGLQMFYAPSTKHEDSNAGED